MGAGTSPTTRSPSVALMRSQRQQSGNSPAQAANQSPARRGSQAPMGPWHCPGNVSPDHAAQLVQRLLSPKQPAHGRAQRSQETLRRAHPSQGTDRLNSSGLLDADHPRHLRVIPETQSMDESPLCVGVLKALPTQTSGISAARAARQASVIPRLCRNDSGPSIMDDGGSHPAQRSQSLAASQTASAKAERRSGSGEASPCTAQERVPHEAAAQRELTPPQPASSQGPSAAAGPSRPPGRAVTPLAKVPQQGSADKSLRERTMTVRRTVHIPGGEQPNRTRQAGSVATSCVETEILHMDDCSGGSQCAGHSRFRPPVCSQAPQPILAMKAGKRRRITPTQISMGGAPRPPSAQVVLRQHQAALSKATMGSPGRASNSASAQPETHGIENKNSLVSRSHKCFDDSCSIRPSCQGTSTRSRPTLAISKSLKTFSAAHKQQAKSTPTLGSKGASPAPGGQPSIKSFFRKP
eukprot:jgi/Ulvmu1/3142/UM015_0182.1